MKLLRSARWLFLALLLPFIPVSSHAGVLISVGIAPPPLVVYDQPVCPQPGWMWTPGYWAYDYNNGGYYWVPGTWVPAPYEGALWTPGYWGWQGGVFLWHGGYWGPHVGYYGGVNYGFGYMGVGFAGGLWRGGIFSYNTAVMHVGVGGGWGGRVYEDRTIVNNTTIINNNHVAFNGGPGGINHAPAAEERIAEHDQHVQPTSFQTQHMAAAQQDRSAFYNTNHGHPTTVAAQRPMTAPASRGMNNNGGAPQNQPNRQYQPNTSGTRPNYGNPAPQNQPSQGSSPDFRNRQQGRQMPDQIQPQQSRPQQQQQSQQMGSQPESRPAPPPSHPQPESHPAPQQHQQEQHNQPKNDSHDHGDHGH